MSSIYNISDNKTIDSEENFIAVLYYKYIPFWPYFLFILVASCFCVWGYLKFFSVPVYEVSATLIIKDEKKGVNSSKMAESIDAFTTNKIVENEIKVLYSRALIKDVVDELNLYAPIYEDGKFKTISAYTSSPVHIKINSLEQLKEFSKIYFTVDENNTIIRIDDINYPIGKWVCTPYGVLKFYVNSKKTTQHSAPLYFSLVNPKTVANSLLNRLKIEAENRVSTVVNLIIKDSVPARGEDILNALLIAYRQMAIQDRSILTASTLEFVEDRIRLLVGELEIIENKIVQFKSSKEGVNLSEQGRLYLENVSDNNRKISEINTQLAVLDKVEHYVVSENTSGSFVPSTLGINDQALLSLLQRLYDSEITYHKLINTTADNNPILVSISNEISNIRPRILESIRNQRNNLKASRTNLVSTNSNYNSSLKIIPQKEKELIELARQQSVKNDAYSFLLQKREETVLSYAPSAGDSKIVDLAESSLRPISPKSRYLYLIAIIFSFASVIGFVSAKELLTSKLLFRSEIEAHVSIPIVGEISYVKQLKRSPVASNVASVMMQFRQLRSSLGIYGYGSSKRKVLVTSSIPGEGKSFVSSNLALSLASSGKKTLLLDFDLAVSNISNLFKINDQAGIKEYLVDGISLDEIIVASGYDNLYLIPAGINSSTNAELMLKSKQEVLFNELEQLFDYIVIDTSPLDFLPDAFLLSAYSDITLFVIRHGYTPKRIVRRSGLQNRLKSLNNLGIVFNGVKTRGFGKDQYGNGYGYDIRYNGKAYNIN